MTSFASPQGALRPAAPIAPAGRLRPDAAAEIHWWRLAGRLGPMVLGLRGEALAVLRFTDCAAGAPAAAREMDAAAPWLVREAARQIDEYLAGRRRDFDLPLDARGSAFAQRVWRELSALRYGERLGYAALAGRLGLDTGHARAVGRAVGANPLLLLLPCHRVVGSDGALRGYAGGVARKRALLDLESLPLD